MDYEECKVRGLEHLSGFIRPKDIELFDKSVDMLAAGKGSRSGCLRGLVLDCQVRALLHYFRDGDLDAMKQWAYLSGKIRIMLLHETQELLGMEELLWPLISDNAELLDWHCANALFYDSPRDPSKKTVVNTHEFARLQMHRALSQQWEPLAEDCKRALDQPELFKRDLQPRLAIFEFFLALAEGDELRMRQLLLDRCTPQQRARSHQFESGLTNDLIVSYATIYAKLAWRAGYELNIETPWIPGDWLPVRPLASYEDPWAFMQSFDIWMPFDGEWAAWSPVRG